MTPGEPKPLSGPTPSDTPESEQALLWVRRARAQEELVGLIGRRVQRRRQRRIALLATACVAFACAGITWRMEVRERLEMPPTLQAGADVTADLQASATVTAPRQQVLPDGSVVEFREGAAIAHDYSGEQRRVTLLTGEAHFRVAKNPARPFVVVAHGVEVRAVGTAFTVQLGEAAVEVVVTEGRVAVESPSLADANFDLQAQSSVEKAAGSTGEPTVPMAEDTPAVLDAGHRAWIRLDERGTEVTSLETSELLKRLAWRIPQLEFSRTPLADIIALMNPHAADRGQLTLMIAASSAELSDLKLSGFLAADNVEGLVRLLESRFGVRAEYSSETIVLHGATP